MTKYTFKIELGDPSEDGHGKYEDIYIKSAGSEKEIDKAFAALKKKGIDFNNICSDYDDSRIRKDVLTKMEKLGAFDISSYEDYDENENGLYCDTDTYAEIMVQCLNTINPKLKIEIVEKEDHPSIGTFGYGLFY